MPTNLTSGEDKAGGSADSAYERVRLVVRYKQALWCAVWLGLISLGAQQAFVRISKQLTGLQASRSNLERERITIESDMDTLVQQREADETALRHERQEAEAFLASQEKHLVLQKVSLQSQTDTQKRQQRQLERQRETLTVQEADLKKQLRDIRILRQAEAYARKP